jgi:hypothetical protein
MGSKIGYAYRWGSWITGWNFVSNMEARLLSVVFATNVID